MTEEEAKRKICPTAGVWKADDGGFFFKKSCIASDCMMWRWAEEKGRFVSEGLVEEIAIYGFCGLAGRP